VQAVDFTPAQLVVDLESIEEPVFTDRAANTVAPITYTPSKGPEMPVLNATSKVRRLAPCGAPLATGNRRLRGIALHRTIERQLREELEAWGIPLDRYDCQVQGCGGGLIAGLFVALEHLALEARYTHRETGAELIVPAIWVDDDGKILQLGTNYGALAL
jgi:hypothetical protein